MQDRRLPAAEQVVPIKRRATATQQYTRRTVEHPVQRPVAADEVPDSYYTTRLPNSTRRYVDKGGNQVIEQGNQRIVIHNAPPRRVNWLVWFGIGMTVMVGLWCLVQVVGSWWNNEQLSATYQYPRIYQANAVVGHNDSEAHPTHFIFENLYGQVIIIEFPGGDYTHAKIYKGPTLYGADADSLPVTATFERDNGRMDIVVHIQGQQFLFVNDGKQFTLAR